MTQFSEETRQKNKVRELSLFGSRARGDERPDSDFDFLVEFGPDADIDLFSYSGLQVDLQNVMGLKVDLVQKTGLKPRIRSRILAEAKTIYEG